MTKEGRTYDGAKIVSSISVAGKTEELLSSLVAQLVKNPPVMAGDPGLISGSGRSPGEGIGYPLQCSWPSLVAQLVKNLLALWETWV